MSGGLPDRVFERLLAVAAEGDSGARDLPALPPEIAARFEIVRELGRGGMGVVYEAVDRTLGRRCALKMIKAGAGPREEREELRRRLVREALAAARLRHPNIAAIHDATADCITMQLVQGVPIDRAAWGDPRRIALLVRDAARAVHHAHEQGIVHRDLKPSNLLVEGDRVVVVDFGLAKEIVPGGAAALSATALGTPAFMPPEQARGRGEAVDARSDVYALGATLHACLSGAPPFGDGELPELLRRIVEDPPRAPGAGRDLDLVVLKCLEKDPARRYPTAAELADDLDRWLASEPVRARRPSLGYRVLKLLARRRALVRAAIWAAAGAVVLTALVLGPVVLRERAARAAASEAVELGDRSAVALRDVDVYLRLGDLESAHQALDDGIAAAREFLARHEVPRMRYLLSRLLRARGLPDEALVELERAIARDPELVEARFERGLMLAARTSLSEGERATAIADLEHALGARAVIAQVDRLFGRGELRRLQCRTSEAVDLLEEVLAYDVIHVPARTSLARLALEVGDQNLAWHYAVSAVDLQQGFGPVYLARERRVLPVAILGLDGALSDFAADVPSGPDNALAYAHRGLVQLRRALRLEADGRAVEARAAVRSAIEDYDATLVVHSAAAGAYNNRAVCRMQAERLAAAAGDSAAAAEARARVEDDFLRALDLDPRLPEAHFNRGVFALRSVDLLRRLGRPESASRRVDEARASFRAALDLAPATWAHRRAAEEKLSDAFRR
jgi:tetratricopeptide (TPR) repeat protein